MRSPSEMEQQCTCGVPNRANVYVHVVIGRDVPGGTETEEIDGYYCTEHEPEPEELVPDGWEALESESTELR